MRCPYNSKLLCYKTYRTEKGLWDWSSELCVNCEVFLQARQLPLEVSKMGKEKTQNWIEKRLDEANKRRREALDKKGFKEFFTFPVGESTIEFKAEVEPREKEGDYGTQAIFRITSGQLEYDLSIGMKSPLYRAVLEALAKGTTKFTIVRTGEKKDTRYTIKKAW